MPKKVQIDNLKELYNSIQRNIENGIKTLNVTNADIETARITFDEANKQNLELLRAIEENKNKIELEKKAFQAYMAEQRLAIEQEKMRLQELSREVNSQVESSGRKLRDNQVFISQTQLSIDTLASRQSEVYLEHTSLSKDHSSLQGNHYALEGRYDDLSGRYKDLEFSFKVLTEQNRKEIESYIAQRNAIKQEIELAQASLSGFKDNRSRMEKEMAQRETDLNVLEARLRIALTSNGIPFKL